MMDRALGAIATGTVAVKVEELAPSATPTEIAAAQAKANAEAVKRFGMVSTIHEVNQWGRKDPFTPATTANTPNWNSPAAEVQIYKADGKANDWTISTWTDYVLTAGQIWNSNIDTFFPASGNRSDLGGNFINVGLYGFYWMSTTQSSISGLTLQFHSNAVNPYVNHNRSHSFPTRCIKE